MAWLKGRWRLTRTVGNRGINYLYAGTATITSLTSLAPCILRYDELALETRTGTIRSTRELLLHPLGEMAVQLMLKDGGHLSTWNFAQPTTVTYECAPDTYVITCEFTPNCTIEEEWHVSGPHKEYIAHQTLVKVCDFADLAPSSNRHQ